MTKLPKKPTGSGSLMVWMRDLVAAVESRQLLPGTGYKLKEYPRGVALEIRPGGTGQVADAVIYAAKLQAAKDAANNYVSVKLATYNASTNAWDETGSAFNVAVPFGLRIAERPHADCTIQIPYDSGDVIWICEPEGGTGVEVSSVDLEWLDCNFDGRSWCYAFDYCMSGSTVTWQVAVKGYST
jgi:hypothetical protein